MTLVLYPFVTAELVVAWRFGFIIYTIESLAIRVSYLDRLTYSEFRENLIDFFFFFSYFFAAFLNTIRRPNKKKKVQRVPKHKQKGVS